ELTVLVVVWSPMLVVVGRLVVVVAVERLVVVVAAEHGERRPLACSAEAVTASASVPCGSAARHAGQPPLAASFVVPASNFVRAVVSHGSSSVAPPLRPLPAAFRWQ